jgi:hypothetical protein
MQRIVLSAGIVVAMGVLCLAGDSKTKRPPATKRDRERQRYLEEFKKLPPMTGLLGKATKVVLYEGLPHQLWEAKLLKEELKTKKTVKINDFPFYKDVLPLRAGDGKKLTSLFGQPGVLVPFSGAKLCGGFHPDYCVEWQLGKDVYRAVICFGCHEVKFHGPKDSVYCDVNDAALAELKQILKEYRKNRPEKKAK